MTNQEKNIALSKYEGFDPYWNCIIHGAISADRILAATNDPVCPWCGNTLDLREFADYFNNSEALIRLRKRLNSKQQKDFLDHLFYSLSIPERNADGILAVLNSSVTDQIEIIGREILKLW